MPIICSDPRTDASSAVHLDVIGPFGEGPSMEIEGEEEWKKKRKGSEHLFSQSVVVGKRDG